MTKSNLCLLNIYCACIKPLIFALNWCIHLFYSKKKKKFQMTVLVLSPHSYTAYFLYFPLKKCQMSCFKCIYLVLLESSFKFSFSSLRVSKTMSIARDESILQTWL